MRFMHFRSEGRIWMGQKQAIESAHDEDQPTFDELGVLPRFLAKLLALEQVRDDGTDPLAAALFSAGGFILNPGGDMLGQVGLDGNIACHAGLHGGGAWNTLRKASLFYLCSFTPSSRLKPADFLSFSPDVICVNGEGYSQVRFDGEAANFS